MIQKFVRDETGATAIEYGLIAAGIAGTEHLGMQCISPCIARKLVGAGSPGFGIKAALNRTSGQVVKRLGDKLQR